MVVSATERRDRDMAKGLLLVETNSSDPARDAECDVPPPIVETLAMRFALPLLGLHLAPVKQNALM